MILRDVHWSLYFLFWTAAIIAAGAAFGAVLFALAGLLFATGHTAGELARNGIRTGGFYCLLWAPGIAVVLCVMRAYRRRHPEAP